MSERILPDRHRTIAIPTNTVDIWETRGGLSNNVQRQSKRPSEVPTYVGQTKYTILRVDKFCISEKFPP